MKEKKEGFLKFIIFYKALLGVGEIILAVALLKLLNKDVALLSTNIVLSLGLDINNHYIDSAIQKLGMLEDNHIIGASVVVLLIGILNLIEAYGLHLRMRWAEWLTVVATSLFIPFELYEVLKGVTVLKISIFLINCAIVYYLAKHKELFRPTRPPRPFGVTEERPSCSPIDD